MSLAELPKTYDFQDAQRRWYDFWLAKGYFHADPSSEKPPYTMVIPPPNVTGALHLGHALNNTLQDILIRWRRMQGYDVLWMPGTDHAGIATQAVVERRLLEEEKKTRHDLGREALVERIWAWKDEYEKRILSQLRLMGCSCDWERTRFTLDPMCARAVRTTFFRLFLADKIYRGKRLVNWDTHLRTAVSDDEIEYEDVKGHLWTIKYPVTGSPGEALRVATTRPETMLGDTAVAVHPDDTRYKHLIGRTITLPLTGRAIPIIADPILVDPTFGTGCVKVTPAHDPNDYQTGLRHKLPMINLLNPDGTYNENAGPYAGLHGKLVRKRVVDDLEAQGLLEKVEPYANRVGISDRSKTPIEPYLSDQWFVRMDDLAENAMDAVRLGWVNIHPERYAKSYLDWLGEKRDWCISRQLWWGHRIPIWHCDDAPEAELERAFGGRADISWRRSETGGWLVCSESDLPADAVPGVVLMQDPDVLDTWFSSALWPHSTLGWPEETPELKKYYPTSVLSTARDIITLWVARMVIFGQFNMGDVPFRDVFIHPVIQDGKGQRMSKSKGNGIDPVDIIDLYGADALRYTLAGAATETQDLRMPVEKAKLPDGRVVNTSERFEQGRTFPNKFWNSARFALMNLEGYEPGPVDRALLSYADRYMLHQLEEHERAVTIFLEDFDFSQATRSSRDFTWNIFCDWYVEFIKEPLREPSSRLQTQRVLAHVLDRLCRVLHPIMPFVSEEVWQVLNTIAPTRGLPVPSLSAESVCVAPWPFVGYRFERVPGASPLEADPAMPSDNGSIVVEGGTPRQWTDDEAVAIFSLWQSHIRAIRNLRASHNVPATAKIEPEIVAEEDVAQKLRKGAAFLARMTGSRGVKIGGSAEVSLTRNVVRGNVGTSEIILPLEGLIDRDAEIARHRKALADLDKQLVGHQGKLNNASYVANAAPAVVEQTRVKVAELRAQRASVAALLGEA